MEISREKLNLLADRSSGRPVMVMPNLVASNFVAEQMDRQDSRFLTIEDQLNFAGRYNYIAYIVVSSYPFLVEMAARRCKELQWQEEILEDGLQIKRVCRLKTPHGELTKRTVYDKKNQLTHYIEEMIKSENDVAAMAWIIRESAKVISNARDEIKREMLADAVPKVNQIKGQALSLIGFQSPIHEVLYPHMGQVAQLYFMHDYPALFAELLDTVTQEYSRLLVEIGIEAKVDAIQTALWGYEQWSPAIYEKYILPYIIPLSQRIKQGKCLFWVHTCGHMKGLIENKMYHRFKPDILECLNYPPAGDVDDWPRLRKMLPEETVTKGNLEDSLLWKGPVEDIRKKTYQILRESEGFKHILGTSNNVFDGTPLSHFEAMMEAVAEYNKSRLD